MQIDKIYKMFEKYMNNDSNNWNGMSWKSYYIENANVKVCRKRYIVRYSTNNDISNLKKSIQII